MFFHGFQASYQIGILPTWDLVHRPSLLQTRCDYADCALVITTCLQPKLCEWAIRSARQDPGTKLLLGLEYTPVAGIDTQIIVCSQHAVHS